MLACICGGILEILGLIGLFVVSIGGSMFGTNWYNKRTYQKYLNKHKDCKCDCHKGD